MQNNPSNYSAPSLWQLDVLSNILISYKKRLNELRAAFRDLLFLLRNSEFRLRCLTIALALFCLHTNVTIKNIALVIEVPGISIAWTKAISCFVVLGASFFIESVQKNIGDFSIVSSSVLVIYSLAYPYFDKFGEVGKIIAYNVGYCLFEIIINHLVSNAHRFNGRQEGCYAKIILIGTWLSILLSIAFDAFLKLFSKADMLFVGALTAFLGVSFVLYGIFEFLSPKQQPTITSTRQHQEDVFKLAATTTYKEISDSRQKECTRWKLICRFIYCLRKIMNGNYLYNDSSLDLSVMKSTLSICRIALLLTIQTIFPVVNLLWDIFNHSSAALFMTLKPLTSILTTIATSYVSLSYQPEQNPEDRWRVNASRCIRLVFLLAIFQIAITQASISVASYISTTVLVGLFCTSITVRSTYFNYMKDGKAFNAFTGTMKHFVSTGVSRIAQLFACFIAYNVQKESASGNDGQWRLYAILIFCCLTTAFLTSRISKAEKYLQEVEVEGGRKRSDINHVNNVLGSQVSASDSMTNAAAVMTNARYNFITASFTGALSFFRGVLNVISDTIFVYRPEIHC